MGSGGLRPGGMAFMDWAIGPPHFFLSPFQFLLASTTKKFAICQPLDCLFDILTDMLTVLQGNIPFIEERLLVCSVLCIHHSMHQDVCLHFISPNTCRP
jgi:hypothetical protein